MLYLNISHLWIPGHQILTSQAEERRERNEITRNICVVKILFITENTRDYVPYQPTPTFTNSLSDLRLLLLFGPFFRPYFIYTLNSRDRVIYLRITLDLDLDFFPFFYPSIFMRISLWMESFFWQRDFLFIYKFRLVS